MDHGACKCAAGVGFALPAAEEHFSPSLRLEPVHQDLSLVVDIAARTVDVHLELRLAARSAGARAIALDAIQFRDLDVQVAGGGASSYDGKVLHVAWDRAFGAGEERSVRLRYRVVAPVTGVLFSSPDADYPDAPTFAVTDHETERARYWLASVDHPSARPTLEIHVRADARYTLLANGEPRGEEQHADGTKTAHFSQRTGCPSYLTCFAVGDFVRWDGEAFEGIPIAAFAPRPFTAEHLARSFGKTRDMLAFLARRLGVPYPFAKYYQFVAQGIGGAMENISLVSWDDRFMLDATLETEERQLVDVVNVHEMAHSWFGDHVVCRDFAHSWLKEGWATYMESVWLEEQEGPDALAFDLWSHAEAYFGEVDERYRRPIVTRRYDSSFDLFDRHLYPGAALRIHMLRGALGDEAFWAGVKDYLVANGGRLVETDDFRRALEQRSGVSLERFFEQWFHRPGFPDLEVTFRHDADRGEGTFEIVQKQADEKTGEGAFDVEIEVELGEAERRERHRFRVQGRRSVGVVRTARSPELIVIDPDGKLLHRLHFDPGLGVLSAALQKGGARARIQAGQLLVRHGGNPGARALRDAFAAEPYWGVRVAWADALGKAASEAALEVLVELGAAHAEPQSLAAVFRALGKYRDPRVREVLERRLDGELPYRAKEAALEALGAQREDAPLERLLAASRRPGFGGFAQAGGLRALGASRRSEALDALCGALRRGAVPNNVRHAAAEGLGALAATLSDRARERAVEALIDALRDPCPKLQLAAAQALGRAKAHAARPALEALAHRLARQDAVRVLRVLRELGESPPERAAIEGIERLEERVRKLSAQLESLQARFEARGSAADGPLPERKG